MVNYNYFINIKNTIMTNNDDDIFYVGKRIFINELTDIDLSEFNHPHFLSTQEQIKSSSNYNLVIDRRIPEIYNIENQTHPWGYLHGCNMIFSRKNAILINGFNESYDGEWGYEDTEFGYKWANNDYFHGTFKYIDGAEIYHQESTLCESNFVNRNDKKTNRNWMNIIKLIPGFEEFKKKQYQQFNIYV